MKRFQKTGLFFLSFLLLSLCFGCSRSDKNENEEEKTFTKYFDVMTDSQGNMVLPLNTSLQLTMTDEQALQQAAEIIEQKLPRWHQLADSHHAYLDENGEPLHNLYYINQHPGQTLEVDPWLLQLLQQAIDYSQTSDGLFHPLMGALSELWEPKFAPFPTENVDPPHQQLSELTGCLPSVSQLEDVLQLDPQAMTIRFEPQDCEGKLAISLGAMAKGAVLDQLAELIRPLNTPFLLNAGDSSIIAWSPSDSPRIWNIGVRHPDQSDSLLFAFSLVNGAVSTSADDQQYFLLNENGQQVRRHHILNPATGISENWIRSVTLTGSDQAGTLDVLSTVLYNIEEPSQRRAMIRRFEQTYGLTIQYGWCEDGEDGYLLTLSEEMQRQRLSAVALPDHVELQVIQGDEENEE